MVSQTEARSAADLDQTIVGIATPPGVGGLGVVRLSGRAALQVACKLFSKPSLLLSAPSHTLHHGWIQNQGEVVDEVVIGVFKAPHSFTGDDVLEISCHGSPPVLQKIVD